MVSGDVKRWEVSWVSTAHERYSTNMLDRARMLCWTSPGIQYLLDEGGSGGTEADNVFIVSSDDEAAVEQFAHALGVEVKAPITVRECTWL